ncbi:unnamed protein product [Cuscuta campestris]|uniref:Uncharacterized protein n=1 Tax=Cuscuta campestris TaxID=132261 RepID=A0A484MJB1_9ASTE|nr:unnamed protein product [Cuscuta campestris]
MGEPAKGRVASLSSVFHEDEARKAIQAAARARCHSREAEVDGPATLVAQRAGPYQLNDFIPDKKRA